MKLSAQTRPSRKVLRHANILSVPADQLGAKVGSLADSGQEIVGALDELFSRAWEWWPPEFRSTAVVPLALGVSVWDAAKLGVYVEEKVRECCGLKRW
jgi:hypothetical protein